MPWKLSKNIVFLLYNPYSCGKFVSNVLSYNQKFVPQFPLDGNRQRWYSRETYDAMSLEQLMAIKHETIMKTIPPTKKDCKDWWEYELGCQGFWGFYFDARVVTNEYLRHVKVNAKAEWLLQQSVNCFMMLHDHNQLSLVQEHFPNCHIVKLINDQHINRLSTDLKHNNERNMLNPVDFLEITSPGVIEFDIGSLLNKTQFFNNIDQLIKALGVTNTCLDSSVDQYYQSYCNLYQ